MSVMEVPSHHLVKKIMDAVVELRQNPETFAIAEIIAITALDIDVELVNARKEMINWIHTVNDLEKTLWELRKGKS